VAQAKREQCLVYTILIENLYSLSEFGQTFANGTGGGYSTLSKASQLPFLMAQVSGQLHHRYPLGFTPVAVSLKK